MPKRTNRNIGTSTVDDPPKSFRNTDHGEIDELRKTVQEIGKDMKDVKKAMNFMNDKFEEWKNAFEKCNEENKKLRDEIEGMKGELKDLQRELKGCRRELIENAQETFQNELELVGMPKVEERNMQGLVEKYLEKVACKVEMKDVKRYKFIPKREEDVGTLRVVLHTKDQRDVIMQKAKKMKITVEDLKVKGRGRGRIYTNERLSQYNKHLLYLAKKTKHDLNWKFVWVKEGKIMLRKDVGQKVMQVITEKDLQEIQERETRMQKPRQERLHKESEDMI